MPQTKGQSNQDVNDAGLKNLGTAGRDPLNTLFDKINTNLDSPLRMAASYPTADSKLNFSSSKITEADGGNKVAPPVSATIFDSLTSPYINFQTQAVSNAGNFDITWPATNNVGQFRRVAFALMDTGKIKAGFSSEVSVVGALANAGTLFPSGGTPIGYIDLVCTSTSGYFKTASSATSIIENTNIYRLSAGAGGGGSSSSTSTTTTASGGGELADLLYLAAIRDTLTATPDGKTPVDIATGKTDLALFDSTGGLFRLNYDATKTVTGSAVQNVLQNTEDFNKSYWTKTRASIYQAIGLSIDGLVNADKLIEDATASNSHYISTTATITANQTWTYSYHVKAAERSLVVLMLRNSALTNGFSYEFDLVAKTVVQRGLFGTGAYVGSSITDLGNGWFRISASGTLDAASTLAQADLYMESVAGSTQYSGDGLSGLFIYGAQLEVGSIMSPYVPSTQTFTSRGSVATYVASNGLVKTAAVNEARMDYNPNGLNAAPEQLYEDAGTNLCLYSEAISNAAWVKTLASVTDNNTNSPTGALTASVITDTVDGSALYHSLQQAFTKAASSLQYTFSVFVKKANNPFVSLILQSATLANSSSIHFNIDTNTFGAVTNAGSFTLGSATSKYMGNGWYRISLTATTDTTTVLNAVIAPVLSLSVDSYQGTGTAQFYMWGAQLELNTAPQIGMTSYIQTTTIPVTRSADVFTSVVASSNLKMALSGAPAFTLKVGDILVSNSEARKIFSLASQTSFSVEGAFTANPTSGACCLSQAVHTVDLNNFTAGGAGQSAYSQFTNGIDECLVGYADTSTLADIIPDFGSAPVIGYMASSDGNNWSAVGKRVNSLSSQDSSMSLPTTGTNMYVRFFATMTSGSGAVNLLSYKIFFQKQSASQSAGSYNTAYAASNMSVLNNCTHTVVNSKSRFTFPFAYGRGLNATEPSGGALDVFGNGQLFPRLVLGTTDQTQAFWKEIDNNIIELDKDYSALGIDFQFKVPRTFIDTNSNNASRLAQLEAVPPSKQVVANDISWSSANVFYKDLSANTTFTFSNVSEGQTIMLKLRNTTAVQLVLTWPTVTGTDTVLLASGKKLYTFTNIQGEIFCTSIEY